MARPPATTVDGHAPISNAEGRRAPASFLDELIADAVDGQNVAWTAGVGFDLAPDVLDVRVDGALVRLHGDTPHRLEQLAAGEDPTRLARHDRQQLKFGGCKGE